MASELEAALEAISPVLQNPWNVEAMERASHALIPQLPFRYWAIIQGDARSLWLKWLVQDAVPSSGLGQGDVEDFSLILVNALRVVKKTAPLLDSGQRREAALKLSKVAYALYEAERTPRTRASSALRRSLLLEAGSIPRCWICGALFPSKALARFRGESDGELPPAPLVDFCYPRGLSGKDFEIEIEHVTPVSAGGRTILSNLRLSCRFCNLAKRDAVSIYSRSRMASRLEHPTLGEMNPPNLAWVSRLLAVGGRCAECGITTEEAQLYAANASGSAYLNPGNLCLYCPNHDPWRRERLVARTALLRTASSGRASV